MSNEEKINVFLSIMAYSSGSWSVEQVKEAFEWLESKLKRPNMSLVSAEKAEKH